MGTLTLSPGHHPSFVTCSSLYTLYVFGGKVGGRLGGGGGEEGGGGACSLVPMQAPFSQAKTNW